MSLSAHLILPIQISLIVLAVCVVFLPEHINNKIYSNIVAVISFISLIVWMFIIIDSKCALLLACILLIGMMKLNYSLSLQIKQDIRVNSSLVYNQKEKTKQVELYSDLHDIKEEQFNVVKVEEELEINNSDSESESEPEPYLREYNETNGTSWGRIH